MAMNVKMSLCVTLAVCTSAWTDPIRLHPENPHYFQYEGKPAILITSAEHYGAVLNLDFDYLKYLDTLARDELNYTRIFTGVYIEREGSFNIKNNTLAPATGRVITPWARSNQPGYINGGNKFDLEKWNPAYFQRLRAFVQHAALRDVIVEVTLFSSIYREQHWQYSPLHPANNVNGTRIDKWTNAHTLDNGNLLGHQEKMVRQIVRRLNAFDNVFFEIQNEPWSDQTVPSLLLNPSDPDSAKTWYKRSDLASDAALAWQEKIASVIADEESRLPKKHLIAQNYCNFKFPIRDVDPHVSILNFHYAWPEAATWNYGWDRVIGFDESGFAGREDAAYRSQAWHFILSGGGLFNNLDYSFVVGHEGGTAKDDAPGGGSARLRTQLKVLKDFIESYNFAKLHPDQTTVKKSPGAVTRTLAEPGQQYAVYLDGGPQCTLTLALPKGAYQTTWINTQTGATEQTEKITPTDGLAEIASPTYDEEIALRIVAVD
jgi:hypothetical protein